MIILEDGSSTHDDPQFFMHGHDNMRSHTSHFMMLSNTTQPQSQGSQSGSGYHPASALFSFPLFVC